MDARQNYLDFVESRLEKDNNRCKSFTMGCALYDYCHWRNGTLSDLWIEDTINGIITDESWADYDWVEWLNDDAKLEILDISILDELGRQIEEEMTVNNDDDE